MQHGSRDQQHGAGLVQRGQPDRRVQEQRRNAERRLEQHDGEQPAGPSPLIRAALPARPPPQGEDEQDGQDRQHPMVELHRNRIGDEFGEAAARPQIVRRHQRAAHQRKRVVDFPGVEAGDEGAERDRQRDRAVDGERQQAAAGRRAAGLHCRPARAGDQPDDPGVEDDCQRQVGSEPVVADRGPVDQAAGDHVPAERALQAAEDEQRGQRRDQPARQAAAQQQSDEAGQEHDADQAAEQPVQIFQPEDRLEAADGQVGEDLPVLRRLPVEVEQPLPGGVAHRRQPAEQGPPFGHRQTGFGQPGQPAEHDHGEDHPGHQQKPAADGRMDGSVGRRKHAGGGHAGGGWGTEGLRARPVAR